MECPRILAAMPPGTFLLALFVALARIFLSFYLHDHLGPLECDGISWHVIFMICLHMLMLETWTLLNWHQKEAVCKNRCALMQPH